MGIDDKITGFEKPVAGSGPSEESSLPERAKARWGRQRTENSQDSRPTEGRARKVG